MTDRATLALSSVMLVAAALWVIAYLLTSDGDGVVVLALLAPAVLGAAGVAGRWGRRHTVWLPAVVPAAAALVVLLATGGLDSATGAFIAIGVLLWTPWLAGRWLRARAALGQAGWQAAARWEDQAREAEDDARRRERDRLAARMHDLVGHDLARAALTLGGLELDTALPAPAQRAVARARQQVSTAAEHLAEAVTAIDATPTATPTGAELDDLVTDLRADGSDVALVPADPSPLLDGTDPAIAALLVRVVREGLTNAVKHGGDGPIEVSFARWHAQIVVVVRSHGANQHPAPGSGHGLAALRRDVDEIGGALEHGRSHDDYLLAVRLPVHHPAPAGPTQVDHAHRLALGDVRRSRTTAVRGTAAVIAVSILLVVAYRAADVATSVLPTDTFTALALGDTRTAVADALPLRTRTDATGIPAPAGSWCEHYSSSPDLLSADLYRLCWVDGHLTSKDLLRRPAADPGTIGT